MAFWYNVVSGTVESDDTKGPGDDLMGPYESQEEAAKALEIAAAKTKEWDKEDAEWEERGSASSGDSW
ncbi:methionine aminopeptidase [Nostocoides veronense]|uniref:Methionine aminopeptidase n=1 Tax=Nostocoides veronense TaxID=330836 RepID=A0ABN2L8I3_9MICO